MIQNSDEYNDNNITTIGNTQRPWHRRRWIQLSAGAVLVAVVILAIVIPASQNKQLKAQQSTSTSGPVEFVPELPPAEVQSNKQEFGQVLLEYYNNYNLNWDVVLQDDSPQFKSLEWVAGSKNYESLDRAQAVQRYALSVFYYSTFQQATNLEPQPQGWTSATNWITATDVCDWEGITCEGEAVTGILLREQKLSGTLPFELAFLGSLTTLDLTTNFVKVNGDADITPFTHMDQLQTLLMEDNYVVTETSGLPKGLEYMTDLKKLVLSYNILQGPLNPTVFEKLTKLTHLEVESNFLDGTIPTALMESTSLVYLYIRRNLLDIDVSQLFAATSLPAIFACWLDSNSITGNLPSTIGNHTDLASLSITNTSLTGIIPTELGSLSGSLRRVWLYENQLQGAVPSELANLKELEVLELHSNQLDGSMPDGVCQIIEQAEYEFKALTADCGRVTCEDCCTECY